MNIKILLFTILWVSSVLIAQKNEGNILFKEITLQKIFYDTTITQFDKSPIGFASVNAQGQNGTSGGDGGDTVLCKKGESILTYLSSKPRVIFVEDTVLTGEIKGFNNISIIGKGNNAAMRGLTITNCKNIIIRNITFYDSPDGIRITTTSSNSSHHIWIDHCTITDSPANDPNGNTHDGALDITHRSSYITVSWCLFYNHRKTCLLGYSASGKSGETEANQLMVTYHHNWFNATNSRHPRARWAPVHVFNNLYTQNSYGIGSTCGAQVFVEANYFENNPRPILISQINDPDNTLSGDPIGYAKAANNFLVNSGAIVENLSGFNFDFKTAYLYKPDPAENISSIVKKYAGAGKVGNVNTAVNIIDDFVITENFQLYQNFPNPFNPTTLINYKILRANHITLKVYDLLGREIAALVDGYKSAGNYSASFSINNNEKSSGIYFYKLTAGNSSETKKMILIK